MDPRCSHLADDPILLDKNVFNNGEPEGALYQIHAGVEIVDRDTTSRRPASKILSECRGVDSRIPLALSDPQVVGGVWGGRDEGIGNDGDKESPPLVRRPISIISLVLCEEELANIGRANQDQVRREHASDFFRADKDSELEGRLTANEEEQDGLTMLTRMTRAAVTSTASRRKTRRLERISRRRSAESLPGLPGGVYLGSDNLIVFVPLPTLPVTRGKVTRPCRQKKRRLSQSVFPDHHPSQNINPGLQNTCTAPPTAAPDTDIGLPIVGTFNVSAVRPHAVYVLYFRLNNLCWPFQPPTADPKPAIEDELESNGKCDIKKIVRKEWVLVDGGYEPRYLVL
jgi:hypothetical protein